MTDSRTEEIRSRAGNGLTILGGSPADDIAYLLKRVGELEAAGDALASAVEQFGFTTNRRYGKTAVADAWSRWHDVRKRQNDG